MRALDNPELACTLACGGDPAEWPGGLRAVAAALCGRGLIGLPRGDDDDDNEAAICGGRGERGEYAPPPAAPVM
jgi:hypothetical protein